MKATEETKLEAKSAGIKSFWLKSEETLVKELEELKPQECYEITDEESSPESIDVEDETVTASAEPIEQELTLPTNVTKKLMDFSIKCRGEHSPYYKYRNLL